MYLRVPVMISVIEDRLTFCIECAQALASVGSLSGNYLESIHFVRSRTEPGFVTSRSLTRWRGSAEACRSNARLLHVGRDISVDQIIEARTRRSRRIGVARRVATLVRDRIGDQTRRLRRRSMAVVSTGRRRASVSSRACRRSSAAALRVISARAAAMLPRRS
jgi:hypothetical protein